MNAAIDAGVLWLRAQQKEDGSFRFERDTRSMMGNLDAEWAGGPWDKGLDALCVYTLAVCDVGLDDPALEKGFACLQRHWEGRDPPSRGGPADDGISTYFVSLCLLALDAAANHRAAPLAKGPPDPRKKGRKLLGKTRYRWAQALVAWLEAAQDPCAIGKGRKRRSRSGLPPRKQSPSTKDGGAFGYGSPAEKRGSLDHSNSQFAMLGLKAASRLGVAVSDTAFLLALRHFLATQESKGPEVPRVPAADAADPKAGRMPGETRTTDEAPATDVARGWGYMCDSASGSTPIAKGPPRGLPPGAIPGLPPGAIPGLPPGAMPTDVAGMMSRPTPAMTAGGVSTLVICRSELDGCKGFTTALRQQTVKGIRDGLAWLAIRLEKERKEAEDLDSPAQGPPDQAPPGVAPPGLPPSIMEVPDLLDDFYFLYGLERACILGGVRSVGGQPWYDLGAKRILDTQRADGAFQSKNQDNGNGSPSIDSCFALLFLKRAVFRVPDRQVVTPSD